MLFDISIEGKKAREARITIIFKTGSCFLISVLPGTSSVSKLVTFNRRITNPSTGTAGKPIYSRKGVSFSVYIKRNAIIKEDKVFWTEGQFDVLSWVKSGIENTVGGSGTAMTTNHLKQLIRFTRNITLVF